MGKIQIFNISKSFDLILIKLVMHGPCDKDIDSCTNGGWWVGPPRGPTRG